MLRRITALLLALVLVLLCAGLAQAEVTRTLKKGSRGEDVKKLQTELKELGFYSGKIDGVYGKKTVNAVKAFQRKNRLKADGVAGPKTQELLFSGTEEADVAAAVKGDADDAEKSILDAAVLLPGEKVHETASGFLDAMAARNGAKCGVLVISKNGQTILTWSFGGVNETTCFRIASITKWVTAIGLMTLYDQGKLDLDRDISDYLPFKVRNPAFPDRAVTARMLLTHTSSLSPNAQDYHPDWARIGKNGYDPIFNESVEPGSLYAYADYNGALFGCLIEAISGKGVQQYLNQAVFQPLGLAAAYAPQYLPAGMPVKDLLTPAGKVAISVEKDRVRPFSNKADPAGNNGYTVGKLYINAESLTKLAQMMLSGGELNGVRILAEETVRLMEADQRGLAESRYGLSTVRLNQFDRGTWYGHQGRYSGLSSNIYYQRETGLTMALIMNGYEQQLENNIVMPAVTVLSNMEKLESLALTGSF